MPDTVPPTVRSRIMSRIKSKGTKPEIVVRRLLHGLGYRYRLHLTHLPGRPDLVFSARRKVVFVNGCFWHYHEGCRHGHVPASNRDYWLQKLTRTRARDERNVATLKQAGWDVVTIWECQLRDIEATTQLLIEFLERQSSEGPKPTGDY